jgi:hypothetical protein
VSDGIAISEISARAAMNFLMTHLLATERCPVSRNGTDRHALQSLRR